MNLPNRANCLICATVGICCLLAGCDGNLPARLPGEPPTEWSEEAFLERVDECGLTDEWVRSGGGVADFDSERFARLSEIAKCVGVPERDLSRDLDGVVFSLIWLYQSLQLTSTTGALPVDLSDVYRFAQRTTKSERAPIVWVSAALFLAQFDRLDDLFYVVMRAQTARSDEEFTQALVVVRSFCRVEARSAYLSFERSENQSRSRIAKDVATRVPWQESAICFDRARVVEAWLGRSPEIGDFVVPEN